LNLEKSNGLDIGLINAIAAAALVLLAMVFVALAIVRWRSDRALGPSIA
jgi:hypothetical protein